MHELVVGISIGLGVGIGLGLVLLAAVAILRQAGERQAWDRHVADATFVEAGVQSAAPVSGSVRRSRIETMPFGTDRRGIPGRLVAHRSGARDGVEYGATGRPRDRSQCRVELHL